LGSVGTQHSTPSATEEKHSVALAASLCSVTLVSRPAVTMSTAAPPTLSEKFEQVCFKFNEGYLMLLYQLTQIADQPQREEEEKHKALLNQAYARWYAYLQANPLSTTCVDRFHQVTDPKHEWMIKRNPQLMEPPGDYFAEVYDTPGIQSAFLFYSLYDADSADPVDGKPLTVDERSARSNMWDALLTQYQLAVILCLYVRTPFVKDIVEMILNNNPGINETNVLPTIMTNFRKDKALRRLIMRLMQGDEDKFSGIMDSLQKVISVFGSEVNGPQVAERRRQQLHEKRLETLTQILTHAGMELETKEKALWLETLQSQDAEVEQALLQTGVDPMKWAHVKGLYLEQAIARPEPVAPQGITGSLGQTMEQLFSAMKNKDEKGFEQLLQQSELSKHIQPNELQDFSKEFEDMSSEWEAEAQALTPEEAKLD
jgi:hypothetical protein